jgi:hypothetical protein
MIVDNLIGGNPNGGFGGPYGGNPYYGGGGYGGGYGYY